MDFETLVVTVDRCDTLLAERMNIQTDAIIGNQCGRESIQSIELNGKKITYYNTADRGVGKNRNLVIEKSTADICILADDDMRFVDGYPDLMSRAVELAPDADIWVFNLIEKNPRRFVISEVTQIDYSSYGKFGAARMAVRRSSIMRENISFSLLFGGGAKYGSGEDTLFLKECLDKKLKIVGVPLALAEMDQESLSTWFSGYNEKFFFDKGALYSALYHRAAPIYYLRFLIKYRSKYIGDYSFFKAWAAMRKGRISFSESIEKN